MTMSIGIHMAKEKFSTELDRLIVDVLKMGELANAMLARSVTAFKDLDPKEVEWVMSKKGELDWMDRDIEERALQLLTLYSPMAKDMRTVACILKMITYLNRIGRYGKDIARDAEALMGHPHISKLVNIPHMQVLASGMLKDALEAFSTGKLELIGNFRERDDEVDSIWESVLRESLTYMMENQKNIETFMHYIMVARYLERCADHACKMAEKVHYMVTGEHIEIK